jgi:Mn2+/Fe2+ NRAMP family transporter
MLLLIGGYRWLDRLTKLLVPLFTVLTLVAAAAMVPHLGQVADTFWPTMSTWETVGTIAFIAALIGWMPTAIDLATWQSLWVLERGRTQHTRPSIRNVMLDFDIGYVCTGVLAFCFLVLGAGTMAKGVAFPTSGTQFPGFFIDMYAETVGGWAGAVVAVAALAVMLSTTVAVLDGFPRVIAVLVRRFAGPETVSGFERSPAATATSSGRALYIWAMVVLIVGSLLLLQVMGNAFLPMVDLATIASFLTAPILAWLNYRVVTSKGMPLEARLSSALRAWSWLSIVSLSAFALFYVAFRFNAFAG